MKSFEVIVESKNLKTGEVYYQAAITTEPGSEMKLLFSEKDVMSAEPIKIPRQDLEDVLAEMRKYLDFVKVQNAK